MRWASPNITFSFAPDGTFINGTPSMLHEKLSNQFPHIRDAFNAWAKVCSRLHFQEVPDDGSPYGAAGAPQGDPGFGDIRFFAMPFAAYASTCYPSAYSTKGGDIILNSNIVYKDGSPPDFFSIILHEIGHALGLTHSLIPTAVMYAHPPKVLGPQLNDDVTRINALYASAAEVMPELHEIPLTPTP